MRAGAIAALSDLAAASFFAAAALSDSFLAFLASFFAFFALASWLPCPPSSPLLHPAWAASLTASALAASAFGRRGGRCGCWRRSRGLRGGGQRYGKGAGEQRGQQLVQWSLSSVLWVGWSTLETVSPPLTLPRHKRLTERHYRPDRVHRQLVIGQPRDSASAASTGSGSIATGWVTASNSGRSLCESL